jgi:progressive ankylosis protein
MPASQQLRLRQILDFYLPLVLTSQMMTLSTPLINLRLSRAADSQLEFAGFSVCFGLLVLFNAPMLVSRDVGAGLAESRPRFHRLLRHTLYLGLTISALDLFVALSPWGTWIFTEWLQSTPRVAARAQEVALGLAPLPALVGGRGLFSALAMRAHRTRLLTEATAARLAILCMVLFLSPIRGAVVGAVALSAGILAETVWITVRAWPLLRALPKEEEFVEGATAETRSFTNRSIARFTLPLVVSAMAWTALRPVINGILGRTADSEAAQASFGVLHPIVLLSASALWALQATGQILVTDRARARPFLRFGLSATFLFTSLVFFLGWIPSWRDWLLTDLFTLPTNLLEYVKPAMRILFVAPLLLGMRACFKGMILATRRTGIISVSAAIDLIGVLTVGATVLSLWPTINGAALGILLVITAEGIETLVIGRSVSQRYGLQRNLPLDPVDDIPPGGG